MHTPTPTNTHTHTHTLAVETPNVLDLSFALQSACHNLFSPRHTYTNIHTHTHRPTPISTNTHIHTHNLSKLMTKELKTKYL